MCIRDSFDTHLCRNVDWPRLAIRMNKLGNQFDIVFSQFAAPRFAHTLKRLGPGIVRAGIGFGGHALKVVILHHQPSLA